MDDLTDFDAMHDPPSSHVIYKSRKFSVGMSVERDEAEWKMISLKREAERRASEEKRRNAGEQTKIDARVLKLDAY